jgi:hypothetical protein
MRRNHRHIKRRGSRYLLDFFEEYPMPEITGKLLADLRPNGTVRMVVIAHTGGGNVA